MYQNIPISIIDRPLASEVFAVTAERRAAIQDEINALERYPKRDPRRFGGHGPVASIGQGGREQKSPSAIGHHESGHVAHSSHERPRDLRQVPKDMAASKVHQSRTRFEEKPPLRQEVSGSKLSKRELDIRVSSLSISESNHDINLPILFGSDPVIDGPLLPNDLHEGGRGVDRSIFYVPLPAQIDYMRPIAPLGGHLPSWRTRRYVPLSSLPGNVVFDLPISAVLDERVRK